MVISPQKIRWPLSSIPLIWDSLPKDIQNIIYEELDIASRTNSLYAYINQQEVFDLMLADVGAKGSFTVAPTEYIDTIREEVTVVMLAELMEETGAAGLEVVTAMEKAIGVTLR